MKNRFHQIFGVLCSIAFASQGYGKSWFEQQVDKHRPPGAPTIQQIVKPIAEQAMPSAGGGQVIVNGIDHLLKELNRIAEANNDTTVAFGRAKTCFESACLSEVYREYEMREKRKEQEQALHEAEERMRADLERAMQENNLDLKKKSLEILQKKIKITNDNLKQEEERLPHVTALDAFLKGEIRLRRQLRELNLHPAETSQTSRALTAELTDFSSKGFSNQQIVEFDKKVRETAIAQGIPFQEINKQIVANLSDEELDTFAKRAADDLKRLQSAIAVDKGEQVKLDAGARALTDQISKMTPKPPAPAPEPAPSFREVDTRPSLIEIMDGSRF